MGVAGFAPFVARLCPGAVTVLPERLLGLAGKTIVIDGTLMTQRFHFRRESDLVQNRHVLGWYRMIKEIQDNGARAICIFDGKSRVLAKKRETERRAERAKLMKARGMMENYRLHRLQKLSSIMDTCRRLDPATQKALVKLMKKITAGKDLTEKEKQFMVSPPKTELLKSKKVKPSKKKAPSNTTSVFTEETVLDVIEEPEVGLPSTPLSEIPSTMASLYADFRKSAAEGGTKHQQELTQVEGEIWNRISGSAEELEDNESELHDITDRSSHLSAGFERSSSGAPKAQFTENQQLLQAMGVSTFIAEGAEAEAVASAMVMSGLADYVASEDTDVLVYQAPLMRNLGNPNADLSIIDGAVVRETLNLSTKSYIDFALLLGTDFTERIPRVGPIRALEFIAKHRNIEAILDSEPDFPPVDGRKEYLESVRMARWLYRTLPDLPSKEDLKVIEPDEDKLKKILQMGGVYETAVFKWNEDSLEGTGFEEEVVWGA